MLRHPTGKHPAEAHGTTKSRAPEGTFVHSQQEMDTDNEHFCSVEVALEDEDSEDHGLAMVREVEVNSAISGILEGEQITHVEGISDYNVIRRRSKRSVIWKHFEFLESLSAARCRICMKKLQCCEGGSTSNLHRHMSKRHPLVFSQLFSDGHNSQPSQSSPGLEPVEESSPARTVNATEKREFPDVTMEDGDSDNLNTTIDVDIDSTINGILQAAQGASTELKTNLKSGGVHHMTRRLSKVNTRTKRSVVWRHFDHLDNMDAAQCRICSKKIQCFEGGSTSNLHRHMSKRHPEVFAQIFSDGHNQRANGDTPTPKEAVRVAKKRPCAGATKFSSASEGEIRVLRREQELVEALRRAQKEEANALQQQRELIEKLRAVNAREAAAEKEQIETLRKAQMEEAEDLRRQREELQREKAELQKKREELQQQS